MKKIVCCLLSFLLIASMSAPTLALNSSTALLGVSVEVPLTPDEIAANAEIDSMLEAATSSEARKRGLTDYICHAASASLVQQQNGYYCGPAATKMVYEGITGDYSKNQSWFATKLGTTSDGSSSANIATVLKNQTGENYSRTAVSGMSLATVYNNIWYSLNKNCAVVASVSNIPGRGYSTSGHFVVITTSANYSQTGSIYYYYNDPHYTNKYFGQYVATQSDMRTAITNCSGYLVRAT